MEDVKQLQDALAAATVENADLSAKNAVLEAEKADLKGDLDKEKVKNVALEDALATTAEQLAAAENAPTVAATLTKRADTFNEEWAEKTFKVAKATYGFLVPQFSYNGALVTYKDILADTTLQVELVEAGHGCIFKK